MDRYHVFKKFGYFIVNNYVFVVGGRVGSTCH